MKENWKKCICVLLCLVLAVSGGFPIRSNAAQDKSRAESSQGERVTLNFNTDWLYSSTDYENGYVTGLDESAFTSVSVPHANKILKTHKGDNFKEEIASYRFVSWYRRHFTLPEEYTGKNITVDFEGVATVADVYLNGQLLDSHQGAYTGFSVDISDYVYTDGRDNVLAVRVNSERQSQIPPEGGSVDYCLFGGIVRDVTMTITDPVHVKRTFVTTPGLTDEAGVVHMQADIGNELTQDRLYTVEMTVLDGEGQEVAQVSCQETMKAGQETQVELETDRIAQPHLWGVEDPYLYTAVIRILDGERQLDSYETRFGMRYFEFQTGPEDGSFYLNGEKLEIVGINRHEQWPWIGRAVPDKLQIQDADLIKASGINAVRCSHYPQDPSFLERCDEIGLLVFAEPPGWQYIGDAQWKETFKTNLEELILRDRNHPSIISWGPRPNESHPDLPFNEECEALAKELDPTRPTHGVRMEFDYEGGDNDTVVNDILTVNYVYPENPHHIPYIVTEHSNDWYEGHGIPGGSDEGALKFVDSFAEVLDYYFGNDKVAGGFGWSMFDYNNEVNYTNTGHVFYSGIYDLFRQEKPVAYLYKSQMDAKDAGPIVYIANNWTEQTTDYLYVMSNCQEIELFVNGTSKGRIRPNKYTSLPHPIFEFTNIPFEEGQLKAVGYMDGEPVEEFVRNTPGQAARLVATADYDTLQADGTDMTSVTVSAVDAQGNEVPFADNVINVRQTDGTKTTLISEEDAKLEGGKLAFLVQSVHNETGTASFEVYSEGLESGTCTIRVEPFEASDLVPVSQGSGQIAPKLPEVYTINDSKMGNSLYQFAYQGSGWSYGAEATAYGEDNHWSDQAGDTCSIRFSGKNIKYYGAKAPGHGIAAFSVDGGEETMVDCYSNTRDGSVLLFDSGELSQGEHVLTVRVTGEKNAQATGCFVNADRAVVTFDYVGPETVANDNDEGQGEMEFDYVGANWGYTLDNTCYMGDNSWSNTQGEYLLIRFTGTSLKYYATKAPNHGIGAFSVDGGEEQLVDFYQDTRESQVLLYDTGPMVYGEHVLKVRVTGDKNPYSTDVFVTADKVEVYDEPCTHKHTRILDEREATCIQEGYTGDLYCTDCKIKVMDGEVLPALGHLWNEGTVTKVPTATQQGLRTYTCTRCGQERTEVIPVTGVPSTEEKPQEKPEDQGLQTPPGDEPDQIQSPATIGTVLIDASQTGRYRIKSRNTAEYAGPVRNGIRKVTIPASVTIEGRSYQVTAVGEKAFRNQKKLTRVRIGKKVTVIGKEAFRGCTRLKAIAMPKGLNKIGVRAFYQCSSLSGVTIPGRVKKIEKQAFYGCKKLRKIQIKTKELTKKSIGSRAFGRINKKAQIRVPKSKISVYRNILRLKGVAKKVQIRKI